MSEQANIGGIRQVLASIESWAEAIYSLLDARLPTKGEPCPCECRRDVEPKPTGVTEPESDTLVEALDALPEGTRAYDGYGSDWLRTDSGWKYVTGSLRFESVDVANYAPIGIESIPGEDVLPLCNRDVGDRDYCPCLLPLGHEGQHSCKHTEAGPDPEPESATVTLPRDVVGLALDRLDKAACWAGDDGQAAAARGHMEAWHALADALDAANAPPEATSAPLTAQEPTEAPEGTDGERLVMACDWSDFRKDYGVSSDATVSTREHRAFKAGWKAGRHGDQSGVLR